MKGRRPPHRPASLVAIAALWLHAGCVASRVKPVPSGCPPAVEHSVSTPVAILLSPLALARDVPELPLRLPYPLLTWIDPGHPANYLFAPFVLLGHLHAVVFFSGTELGVPSPALEVIFDPVRCGWMLAPSLRALW